MHARPSDTVAPYADRVPSGDAAAAPTSDLGAARDAALDIFTGNLRAYVRPPQRRLGEVPVPASVRAWFSPVRFAE